MINRIIRVCIRKRLVVIVVASLVAAFGYYTWKQLTVEAYPDIGDVNAQVCTQAPGAGLRGGRTTDHHPAGAGVGRDTRTGEHAFEQHFRPVAHHPCIS